MTISQAQALVESFIFPFKFIPSSCMAEVFLRLLITPTLLYCILKKASKVALIYMSHIWEMPPHPSFQYAKMLAQLDYSLANIAEGT
jgi:hypothetical protein